MRNKRNILSFIVILVALACFKNVYANENRLFIIQMGDFHSHFHSHPTWGGSSDTSVKRGGAAHVKTAIKGFIKENNLTANDLLVIDNGDWSEGSMFYKDGLGIASLQMLGLLGVEVSVLGNHDFYNGPDVLENTIQSSGQSFPILAANLKYPKNLAKRLSDKVQSAFQIYKPAFATNYEMAFFTRLFLTFSNIPNDIEQAAFYENLGLFLGRLREKRWTDLIDSADERHRFVNITNIDSLLETSKEEEIKTSLWNFWSAARKNVKDGDINKYVLEKPLLADSYLISKGSTNVCLFGIVTHEIAYQHFFDPVKIEVPYPVGENPIQLSVAEKIVKHLRESGACDLVIALTHQTDQNDRILAEKVEGIDLILGGHSHNLMNPPINVTNKQSSKEVPIFKAGKFGETLSTFSVLFKRGGDKKSNISDSRTVEISTSLLAPDKEVEEFVNRSMQRIEELDGKNLFTSKVIDAENSLERFSAAESLFGNYLTSGIRFALENMEEPIKDLDLVMISPFFISSDLPGGEIYEADLFNLLSLIYRPDEMKSWRIATIDINGKSLRVILNALFERGMVSVTDEKASIIFDPSRSNPFIELRILDPESKEFKPISDERVYRMALPEGILEAFNVIQEVLKDVTYENDVIYDIELWEALSSYLKINKTTADNKTEISQRLSSASPDLSLSRRDLKTSYQKNLPAKVVITIRNNGQASSPEGEIVLSLDENTPGNVFDNGATCGPPYKPQQPSESQLEEYEFNLKLFRHWEAHSSLVPVSKKGIPPIPAGKSVEIEFNIQLPDLKNGSYPVLMTASLPEGMESVTENNRVEGLLLVP